MLQLSLTPTIQEALRQATEVLRTSSAQLDAELLLCDVLGKPRSFLRAWPEYTLTSQQVRHFSELINRRFVGEPVAYLIGHREFWSLELLVNEHTLIPRPETEILVEAALQRLPADFSGSIADLGTGSGAIALAIAKERPRTKVFGVDKSIDALNIARSNAQRNAISNVEFLFGSWLEPLADARMEMIVSNPPYIALDDPHLGEGDLRFEPLSALCSGADGLDALRYIVNASRDHLTEHGWLLLEHGFNQGDAVRALFHRAGYRDIQTLNDLAGQPRTTTGQWQAPYE